VFIEKLGRLGEHHPGIFFSPDTVCRPYFLHHTIARLRGEKKLWHLLVTITHTLFDMFGPNNNILTPPYRNRMYNLIEYSLHLHRLFTR
jgi:hypothetical protein